MVTVLLSVGIGAGTAVFSAVYNVLLKPLSYPESERLAQLWPEMNVDKLIAATVAERGRSFAAVSPVQSAVFSLSGGDAPVSVRGARVGARFFDVLRSPAQLGRVFAADENGPGKDDGVVLGNGLWRRYFGGNRGVIGRAIVVDGVRRTVVGVMPAGFQPLEKGWELWLPLRVNAADIQDFQSSFYLKLIARLNPGVSPASAEAELLGIGRDLRATYPNLITNELLAAARCVTLQEYLVRQVRPILLTLMAAVWLMMLIVCVNVATLLLSRGLQRRGELALRAALGARRSHLVRDVALENVLLGLAGGLAGLWVATELLQVASTYLPFDLPRSAEVGLDGPVLIFDLAISLLAALVFSVWPVHRAMGFEIVGELRAKHSASAGSETRRVGRFLVASQVAMAMALLIISGLLVRSLQRLEKVDAGFRPAHLVTFRLDLPAVRFKEGPQIVSYFRRVSETAIALPGVRGVGAIQVLPLTADNWSFPYLAQDHPIAVGTRAGTALPEANFRVISPDYFRCLGVGLQSGRLLGDGDDAQSANVGLINHTLATLLWPGGSALGKKFNLFGDDGPAFTVVGVVDDVRQHRLGQPAKPEIYRPLAQWPVSSMYIVVRSSLRVADLAPALRRAIGLIDPQIPISDLRSFTEVWQAAAANERATERVVVSFSAFAWVLALIGLYATISYNVRQRQREFGIRVALGARRGDILRGILVEGVSVTVAGLLVGSLISLPLARAMADRLYQTSSADPGVFAAVAGLVLAGATVSSLIPAVHAARRVRVPQA